VMHMGFGPDEWLGGFILSLDESIIF
jgi:hypothetical protein